MGRGAFLRAYRRHGGEERAPSRDDDGNVRDIPRIAVGGVEVGGSKGGKRL